MDTLLLILMLVMLVISIGILCWATTGLMFIFGAPFVPTSRKRAREMLKLAQAGANDIVLDLGSGHGAIIKIAAKDFGVAEAIGYELHPALVLYSKLKFLGRKNIHVRLRSIIQPIEHKPTIVTLYLLEPLMKKVQPYLAELPEETKIVSHGFEFRGTPPRERKVVDNVEYLLYFAGDLKAVL